MVKKIVPGMGQPQEFIGPSDHDFRRAMAKTPDGFMPVRFGAIETKLWGGPYRNKPEHMFGIKMAEEIRAECDVDIPTRDFSVPPVPVFLKGLEEGICALIEGEEVYVGCMGGIGRTGLYMAAVAKVMGVGDPVAYVRQHYKGHAVETVQQQAYIAKLDVSEIQALVVRLTTAAEKTTLEDLHRGWVRIVVDWALLPFRVISAFFH